MITERQENILNELIREYIATAKPVSSELLEKKSDFSSATIRNEMKKLTDMGYFNQPHTSAGRIPTNKAYRFFVDELFDECDFNDLFISELEEIKNIHRETLKFAENLAKKAAEASSELVFAYIESEDHVLKDGWKEVFKNPEFEDKDFLSDFVRNVDKLEEYLRHSENSKGTEVYIGREKSILDSGNFSLIISKNSEMVFAILGPSRMKYDKNIAIINTINNFLNE